MPRTVRDPMSISAASCRHFTRVARVTVARCSSQLRKLRIRGTNLGMFLRRLMVRREACAPEWSEPEHCALFRTYGADVAER